MTSLDALIPELIEPARALIDLAGRAGVQPRITSTLRTHAEQERLYRRFRQGLNAYPVAPPGTSAHEYGYAFDLVVSGEENQRDLGSIWQQWGGIWGGLGDPVHFEYPGFSLSDHFQTPFREKVKATAQSTSASVADFVLGFVPGLGQAEMIATVAELLGVPSSVALDLLSSPVSYVQKNYPEIYDALAGLPIFFGRI